MLIDTIKTEANGLMLGQISQAQIDTLKANVALLVADAVVPAPAPAQAGTSPVGTTVPPNASITDDLGTIWTRNPWLSVLRNGADTGFYASLLKWTGAHVEATNKDTGNVWYWNGNGWSWTGH